MSAPINATGAGTAAPKVGTAESRVIAELRRLQSDMDDVESAVGVLFDRLQGVLSPNESASGTDSSADALESPLVEELKRRRRQAQRILENLEELRSRIEL